MKAFVLAGIGLCVLLVGCSGSDIVNKERTYPYFSTMPSDETIEEYYQMRRHTLSPVEDFHFDILVPKDWEILDIVAQAEPAPNSFKEIGVFRQPGAWMNSDSAPQNGEISVSAVHAKENPIWASVWLQDAIATNSANYEILEKHTVETPRGDAVDMLVGYSDGKQQIMNRVAAFRDDNWIYVISGSDTVNGYRDIAEAFYVAIESFTLASGTENPFSE